MRPDEQKISSTEPAEIAPDRVTPVAWRRGYAPPQNLSREEEATLALENTRITPGVAWLLCAAFLLTIFSVPILQYMVTARRHQPEIYPAMDFLPTRDGINDVHSPRDAWALIPGPRELKDFEQRLEDNSIVVRAVLPRAQAALARLGVGNEQAYIGRDGWLYYRPDVEYLTSRGFLDPTLLRVRKRAGDAETDAVQPDPLAAMVSFQKQLARRGITLIILPTPVKPMLQPEYLSSRYPVAATAAATSLVLQNPSYAEFRRQLQQAGVIVFDVSEKLAAAKRQTGQAQYLATDTHWTPAAMERAAAQLARFIENQINLPPRDPANYTRDEPVTIANIGDIAEMLKLPANQTLYPRQYVHIHPVRTADGELWYPQHDADILLLGDSFSNIYSLDGMGWGEGAGFAEQLSYALQRPVDAITNNAGGSYVTRERLARELTRGRDRLAGKRIIVWQFAMRDLLSGDWKLLDLPAPKKN